MRANSSIQVRWRYRREIKRNRSLNCSGSLQYGDIPGLSAEFGCLVFSDDQKCTAKANILFSPIIRNIRFDYSTRCLSCIVFVTMLIYCRLLVINTQIYNPEYCSQTTSQGLWQNACDSLVPLCLLAIGLCFWAQRRVLVNNVNSCMTWDQAFWKAALLHGNLFRC